MSLRCSRRQKLTGTIVAIMLLYLFWQFESGTQISKIQRPSRVSLGQSGPSLKEQHHDIIKPMYWWSESSRHHVVDCMTGEKLYTATSVEQGVRFSASLVDSLRSEGGAERQQSFQQIYRKGGWGQQEPSYDGIQGSGPGSSIQYTERIRLFLAAAIKKIKKLLNKKRITFLDVPCGDMVWMPKVLDDRSDIIYTGMEIVPELIESHKKRFSNKPWKFVHGDIVSTPLMESYDIIFCRHLLQHLRTADAATVLENFSESGSKFLITTTWLGEDLTYDVLPRETGRIRPLNLEINPIALGSPQCIYKDWSDDSRDAYNIFIGVWTLPLKHIKNCTEDLKPVNFMVYRKSWYTCSMPKGLN